MKRLAFVFAVLLISITQLKSQCIQNCMGYTLSSITYSAFPSSGISVSSAFSPNNDDGYTTQIPLGFSFNYYCATYSTVLICSNGFLVFGSTPSINGADPAQSLPSTTAPDNMIAFNMNDLDVTAGGNITYTTIGTSPNQMFIVTYSDVPIWNANTVINTGQIILYETSNMIEVHTATVGLSPYFGTQGIENSNGTSGIAVSGRNAAAWSASLSAYRWEKTLIGAPPTGVSGPTTVCFGEANLLYTCNTMTGASSYSWSLPGGWSGSSTTTALTATAGITGDLTVTATYTCGVSLPALLTISVNPAPIITIATPTPPIICSGSVVAINPSGAASYTLDPGGITGTTPFTVVAAANTVYSISGTGSNGCVSTTPVIVPLTVNQSPTVSVNSGSVCLGSSFTMSPTGANSYSYSSLFSVVTPSFVGTYSYLVIGGLPNTCLGYAVSTLTVNPVPIVSASANRTVMCINETVSLTAYGANSYTWAHSGATTSMVTISPQNPGVYTVTGKNGFGCSTSATITIIVNPCVGIGENEQYEGFSFSVFPNPASSNLTFYVNREARIFICDATGKEVHKVLLEAGEQEVNLTGLPGGIYFVRAIAGGAEKRLKLIVEP